MIAEHPDLDDRIDAPSESEAFISIKDHKQNFPSKITCRLINPAKNNIGTISKNILDRVNSNLRQITKSNQWQNTAQAIEWFTTIPNKEKKSFFKFDIINFYPSITEELLTKALDWAQTLTSISQDDRSTIMHCRQGFLFFKQESWVKMGK